MLDQSGKPSHHEVAAAACEGALLQALRLRRQEAMESLCVAYGPALVQAAQAMLGDRASAEDVAQETLMAAWDASRRAADGTRLKPWLMGILANLCRKHRRSVWRRWRREMSAARQRRQAEPAVEDLTDRLAALKAAMAALDEPMRAAVVLRYQQGLSVAEVAAALKIPEGTVKSRCHVACEKLRSWMEHHHGRE